MNSEASLPDVFEELSGDHAARSFPSRPLSWAS
jgi:hypothetical protein